MAQVVKQFSYNTNLEGWLFFASGGTGLTGTRDTTEDSPNDVNAGTGVMQTRRAGQNLTDGFPAWVWGTGTLNWEGLGVPAGAIVTAVNLNYDWRCSEYTTGAATSRIGAAQLYNSAGTTLRGTFSLSQTFGATSSFATKAGTEITGLSDASNTTIQLRINCRPHTGDSPSAAVTLRVDWVVVTITYSLAVGRSLSSTWNIRAAVGASKSSTWNIRAEVGRSVDSTWNVRASAGRSQASTWNIRTVVGASRPSAWNIRSTAGKSIASAWNMREAVGAEFDSAWSIRVLVGRSLEFSWNLQPWIWITSKGGYFVVPPVRTLLVALSEPPYEFVVPVARREFKL